MNKIWTFISLSLAMYGSNSFCYSVYEANTPWTGFYIGGNAGYLWSASNNVTNTGEPTSANPLGLPNSQIISNSLSTVGFANLNGSTNGFIGGGQIGYNSQFTNNLVIGIDVDLDAIGQSSRTFNFNNSFTSMSGLGTYNANVMITKKLNYLGLLKGRLGFLVTPTFLIYGAGAYAYGGASLNTSYSITETTPGFLPINQQGSVNNMLSGWAGGGGVEWLFSPKWSMKLEYIYYNLGPINNQINLSQFVANNPTVSFATATGNTLANYSENAVRLGMNFHFA